MKIESELRLARMASADCWHGGAGALALANRIERITGSSDAVDVVSRVYSHPRGQAVYECRECGQDYLTSEDAAGCCND
jgi:hypothetical protein